MPSNGIEDIRRCARVTLNPCPWVNRLQIEHGRVDGVGLGLRLASCLFGSNDLCAAGVQFLAGGLSLLQGREFVLQRNSRVLLLLNLV